MSSDIQVTLSSGGTFHAYQIVRAAQHAGYLRRFITTLYNKQEAGIDRSLLREILLPELIGQVLWRLPGNGSMALSYLVRDNLFDRMARRYIDGGDIFHVFSHFGLHSMRKAHELGMKVIVERSAAHPAFARETMRTEYARYGLRYPALDRLLIRKHDDEFAEADAIMVPSAFVARTLTEYGVDPAKLLRVHFGFEPQQFRPMPETQPDDVFRVIFVGSVSLQKGVPYLLEAFRQLNLPDAELLFVGGAYPDSKAFLPQYAGLFRHVWFVPPDELARLYNTASVFVLPSLQDGFGMVVYEAAACGLPVIISENVGATIRDGQDGFIVPTRNADALAECLLRLYQDRDLRRTMGESARQYVQQFTWAHYHAQVIAHYRALLGRD